LAAARWYPAIASLRSIARRVRWITTEIVDAANRGRPNSTVKESWVSLISSI